MLLRTGCVMVLVGAVISLSTIPLSMSSAPGARSLIAALSSVGLIWPLLGEGLIVIGALRLFAERRRAGSVAERTVAVSRIAIQRRIGVALVAIGGALLLTPAVVALVAIARAFHSVSLTAGPSAAVMFGDTAGRAAWLICIVLGGGLLVASEVELRRS